MITYDTIKQLARDHGITIADLCALSPKNDPFYTGRPSEVIAAEWFAELWNKFGYRRGVHLRRVHYQIVSQNPPVNRPDGSRYENTETCWDYLNEAAKWARYLHLVSPAAFVDRRNPEAVVNAYWPKPGDWNYEDPTPDYSVTEWDDEEYELPELPALPGLPEALPDLPSFEVSGYQGIQQAFHVEVWCEKTTMNDVLGPLCQRYGVNLVTGAGELSITAVVDFMRRAQAAERPARILYVSDFDPAGMGMPISVARKIEYFQRNEGFHELDIRLQPVVLTTDQVERYTLPRVPVKDTDLRKANFEAAYGQGQVELDALEALYPGELARIMRQAILQYHDPTLTGRALEQREALRGALRGEIEAVLEDYTPNLNELAADYFALMANFNVTREEFADLIRDFQPKIDAYQEQLEAIKDRWGEVYDDIRLDLTLKQFDLGELFPLPEPNLPEEPDGSLYDSRREYLDQLQAYKAQRFNIGAANS
ncbi:MAG: hypothetical protein KJ077_05870 [Anaerolineae bacterium]|nr:hypothetical protein [Anaerolineae bacterium]